MDSSPIRIPSILCNKICEHTLFALETRLYIDAYMWEWVRSLSMTGAIMVCVVEMTIALLAIKKDCTRVASTGFFLMLSYFVYLTGVNLAPAKTCV